MSSLAKFTHAEVKGGFVATKGIFKSQLSIGADGNIVGNLMFSKLFQSQFLKPFGNFLAL